MHIHIITLESLRTRRKAVQLEVEDASVSECTWTLSALEALRNALYKFKTYLLTYFTKVTENTIPSRSIRTDTVSCSTSPVLMKPTVIFAVDYFEMKTAMAGKGNGGSGKMEM